MVKDALNSIFDNIKERTTNPFLGTLLAVWSIKNWRLIYSLLYFDSKLTLDQRLAKISEHFANQSFVFNMIITIGITMAVLVTTYIMLGLSRLLTDYYDNVIIPKSAEVTSKGSAIVLKVEHYKVQEEKRLLEVRLQEERLAKVSAQNERDQADEKLAELLRTKNTISSNETPSSPTDIEFIRIGRRLENDYGITVANNKFSAINRNVLMGTNDDLVKYLALESIVEPTGKTDINGKYYRLTAQGKEFLRYWNNNFSERVPKSPSKT